MARASAWGLGTALAYRKLDTDAQAELLALWMAARVREGEEAEMVLVKTVRDIAEGVMASRGGDGAAPTPPVSARTPASARNRMTEGPVPDILRPRLGADTLVSFGS